MRSADLVVRLFEECAPPGTRATVYFAGRAFALPVPQPEPIPATPDPVLVALDRLLDRDAATRAASAAAAVNARETSENIALLLEETVKGQEKIAAALTAPRKEPSK